MSGKRVWNDKMFIEAIKAGTLMEELAEQIEGIYKRLGRLTDNPVHDLMMAYEETENPYSVKIERIRDHLQDIEGDLHLIGRRFSLLAEARQKAVAAPEKADA